MDVSPGNNYLSPSSFKNLVGRVCRFGEIFNNSSGDLKYLLPEIYIIKGKYCRKNFNVESFVKGRKILVKDYAKITDDIKNPLLIHSDIDNSKTKKAEEILENISHCDNITDNSFRKPKTKIGQLCFENNINIFDIFEIEEQIDKELENINKAQSMDIVFNTINYLFFSKINDNQGEYNNLKRLREHEAQNFYKMLINWRIMGFTMKVMIDKMVGYWNTLREEQSRIVYVGKWGDKTRGGHKEYWTDITEKDEYEKVNLAIVRLKEEYDFIDNELVKYIEILYSLELIEESLYLISCKIKCDTK